MSSYDLIAFDMDGTLLGSDKKVREDSISAINRAVRAGKTVALSTGRSLAELTDFRDQFDSIHYFMCASGAYIYDNFENKVLYSQPIPSRIISVLFERVSREDLMVHIHSNEMLVQKDKQQHMSDYNMGIYQPMFDRITLKIRDLERYCLKTGVPVYKFNLYCRNACQRSAMKERLCDLPISIAYAETTSLECSAAGVSKASGLVWLCRHMGIPVECAIAVGDADNDLEILKTAGLGIAMGNANENARSVCDVIVAGNDEGGCAEAIDKYLLN